MFEELLGFFDPLRPHIPREQGGPRDNVLLGIGAVEEHAGLAEHATPDVPGDHGGPGDDISVGRSIEQLPGVRHLALAAELGDQAIGVGHVPISASVSMGRADARGRIAGGGGGERGWNWMERRAGNVVEGVGAREEEEERAEGRGEKRYE